LKLRNKIEHRFMPSIDKEIVWECQALLINFEKVLVKEFWTQHTLIETLFIPLQLTTHLRKIPFSKDEKKVLEFINTYRSSLNTDTFQSSEFSYRMFLIPKLWKHINSSDITIEFVKIDELEENEKKQYEKFIIWIKNKETKWQNFVFSDDPNAIKVTVSYEEAIKTHSLTSYQMRKNMRDLYSDYPDWKWLYNKLIKDLKDIPKLCIKRLTNPLQKKLHIHIYIQNLYTKIILINFIQENNK
jgi:hypothetical protein